MSARGAHLPDLGETWEPSDLHSGTQRPRAGYSQLCHYRTSRRYGRSVNGLASLRLGDMCGGHAGHIAGPQDPE